MSTGVVAAIVVAVLVVIAIVAALAMARGGPSAGRLKHRFGPEYDRTLARHDGDVKATRKELATRVERYGKLERRPLSQSDRERYTAQWDAVQAHFVEEPARAVAEADRLIGEVAADRGFPAAGSPEHFDALSVHHAQQVQGYRQAHALAEHAGAGGRGATEDLRQSLVSARQLFRELVADDGKTPRAIEPGPSGTTAAREDTAREAAAREDTAREDTARGETARKDTPPDPLDEERSTSDPDAPRDTYDGEEAEPEHRSLHDRFAALTGAGRKDHSDGGHA